MQPILGTFAKIRFQQNNKIIASHKNKNSLPNGRSNIFTHFHVFFLFAFLKLILDSE